MKLGVLKVLNDAWRYKEANTALNQASHEVDVRLLVFVEVYCKKSPALVDEWINYFEDELRRRAPEIRVARSSKVLNGIAKVAECLERIQSR